MEGHSILVVKKFDIGCPSKLTYRNLRGIEAAIAEVVNLIMQHFQPKDILFASLRGREPHIHLHLVPLWADLELEWRAESGHIKGHLFEYLGTLEKNSQLKHVQEREEQGWIEDEQREKHLPSLLPHVEALRALASNRSVKPNP